MSGQMDRQDKQLDAAEYVIGTMSAVERAAFEVLIAQDKNTREDVAFWERSFGALNASVSPETPPKDMWSRIEALLFDPQTTNRRVMQVQRRPPYQWQNLPQPRQMTTPIML